MKLSKQKKSDILVAGSVYLVVAMLFSVVIGGVRHKDPAINKMRAEVSAKAYVSNNDLIPRHLTCTGDNPSAVCYIVLNDYSRIMLSCPSGLVKRSLFGDRDCKQIDFDMKLMHGGYSDL